MSRPMRAWFALWVLVILIIVPSGHVLAQSVTVTAADPSSALQGTTSLDVTVSGNGFDSTAQVNFLVTGTTNTGGITVKKVSVRGSKKLVATIDIADSALVDKFDIEVVLSNGRKGKGTTLFTVQQKPNSDACTLPGLVFPYYVYYTWTQSNAGGTSGEIRIADQSGRCSRVLARTATTTFPPQPRMLDIGGGVWRVWWREDGDGSMLKAADFSVGSAYTINAFVPVRALPWAQRVASLEEDPTHNGAVLVLGDDLTTGSCADVRLSRVEVNESGGLIVSTLKAFDNCAAGWNWSGWSIAADRVGRRVYFAMGQESVEPYRFASLPLDDPSAAPTYVGTFVGGGWLTVAEDRYGNRYLAVGVGGGEPGTDWCVVPKVRTELRSLVDGSLINYLLIHVAQATRYHSLIGRPTIMTVDRKGKCNGTALAGKLIEIDISDGTSSDLADGEWPDAPNP